MRKELFFISYLNAKKVFLRIVLSFQTIVYCIEAMITNLKNTRICLTRNE